MDRQAKGPLHMLWVVTTLSVTCESLTILHYTVFQNNRVATLQDVTSNN
jgi:hypothetical protein